MPCKRCENQKKALDCTMLNKDEFLDALFPLGIIGMAAMGLGGPKYLVIGLLGLTIIVAIMLALVYFLIRPVLIEMHIKNCECRRNNVTHPDISPATPEAVPTTYCQCVKKTIADICPTGIYKCSKSGKTFYRCYACEGIIEDRFIAPQLPQLDGFSYKNSSGCCGVCGEVTIEQEVVYCQSCQTPHHNDCWKYNGGCSIYACQCKTSTATPPTPHSTPLRTS